MMMLAGCEFYGNSGRALAFTISRLPPRREIMAPKSSSTAYPCNVCAKSGMEKLMKLRPHFKHWVLRKTLAVFFVIMAELHFFGSASFVAAANLEVVDYSARNFPRQVFFTPKCTLRLSDTIRAGDADRMKTELDQFRLDPRRNTSDRELIISDEEEGYYALCLESSGGEIREALKIGNLFKNWMTVIEPNKECYSACAMLFMLGGRRDFVFYRIGPGPAPRRLAGRYLHYSARLGFHAPRLNLSDTEQITRQRAEEEYQRAIKTVRAIIFRNAAGAPENTDEMTMDDVTEVINNDDFISGQWSQSQNFANAQYIPNDLLLAILSVPPNELFEVTTLGQAIRWGIEPYGFETPRYISTRMLTVGCANLIYARCIMGGPHTDCTTLGSGRIFFRAGGDLSETGDEFFSRIGPYFRNLTKRLWPVRGHAS